MPNDTIDDEWADLLGDDTSGPTPVVAPTPAVVNKTVRAPAVGAAPVPTVNKTQRAPVLAPVPTVSKTRRTPLITPARRPAKVSPPVATEPSRASATTVKLPVGHDAPEPGTPTIVDDDPMPEPEVAIDLEAEDHNDDTDQARPSVRVGRKTASVVALSSSSADTLPYKSRPIVPKPKVRPAGAPIARASESGRHATRRLVVPTPGGDVDDDVEITVDENSGELPAVPNYAGDGLSNPLPVETVTVPEPSDVIDVGLNPPTGATLDPSADIELDPAMAPVAAEESIEPLSLSDSELISVKPVPMPPVAVPQPIAESTSVPGLDEIARQTVKDDDESASASQSGVPHFGALNDVAPDKEVARSSSSSMRAYVPQMAEPMVGGGGASFMPWLLGIAAVAVLGVIAWMALTPRPEATAVAAAAAVQPSPAKTDKADTARPEDKAVAPNRDQPAQPEPSAGVEPEAPTPAAQADEPADAEPVAIADAEAEPAEAEPAEAEPAEAEPDTEPDVDPEPEPAEPEPTVAAAPVVADAGVPALDPDAASRYAAAAKRYASDESQEALEAMAKAACAMDDGVRARSAFRKLKGGDVRSSVMIACRKTSVDLTAKGDEPTPAELVRAARRALAAGDHAGALELARKSNRLERSQDAILVSALAACAAGSVDKASSMRRHLGRAQRKALAAQCPAASEDG